VLSYEPAERLLDVTLGTEIVRGGRTKARKAAAAVPRAVGLEVTATVIPLTTQIRTAPSCLSLVYETYSAHASSYAS
jgi:hypothetical protein